MEGFEGLVMWLGWIARLSSVPWEAVSVINHRDVDTLALRSGDDCDPAPHVEGHCCQQHLAGGFGQATVAHAPELHAALEGGEGGFHRGPPARDQAVEVFKPRRQNRMVLVGPAAGR